MTAVCRNSPQATTDGTVPVKKRSDSFASYFWYPEDYTSEDDRESFVLSDDVDVLYNLAQSGIENVKKGITPNTLYSSQTSMQTDKDPFCAGSSDK